MLRADLGMVLRLCHVPAVGEKQNLQEACLLLPVQISYYPDNNADCSPITMIEVGRDGVTQDSRGCRKDVKLSHNHTVVHS